MKVAAIATFLVQPPQAKTALFVKVEADTGLHGWGEAYTLAGRERALEQMIRDLGASLIGRDPRQIKHFTHALYRDVAIKRGSVDYYAAVSSLEIALWDLLGKALQAPIYDLLGGACRTRFRLYGQPSGEAAGLAGPAAWGRLARNTVERGYDALKVDPFPGPWQEQLSAASLDLAVERVAAIRAAVGPHVDILIEGHRRLAPAPAVRVAQALEPYRPFWFEEPTPAEDLEATAEVRRQIRLPVVVGETLYTKHDFRRAFEARAADIINPDVCNVGGVLEMKEIAAMAEAYSIALAPHGNNSTLVGLAASLQVAACSPNFLIMEYPLDWEPYAAELALSPWRVEQGTMALPRGPGLGLELDEEALGRYPYRGVSVPPLAVPEDERF
jgi:galactonate dehydratase